MSCCEVNADLRQRVADTYRVRETCGDIDELLANPPGAAVICTPAHLHVPLALRLAEAGVHLLIEKPLSTDLDQIEQLAEMIEQRQLVTAVAYVNRMHPVLHELRRALRSGRYGRPVQLVMVAGQHFPYYRPAYREIYYADRAMGGGAIQDGLTHMINAGEWLVGPISRVAADADHQVLEGVRVEDTVHVIARHGSVQAAYCLNQHQAANESTLNVMCERGMLQMESHLHRWRWKTAPEEPWQEETARPIERDELFVRQAEMFLDAIESGTPVACTFAEGLATLRANLAILRAADSGTWQKVN